MAADVTTWEILFQRALELIDSVSVAGITLNDWSFGGGTVLMRRHRHRMSKDVDIFIGDPQYLGYITPRLNAKAETMTTDYIEQAGFLKLYFPDGEIDFVAAGPLTDDAFVTEMLFGREVQVETSTEIVAKKVWYRGDEFTARDIFDLAMVAEWEPEALAKIQPLLHGKQEVILRRIESHGAAMRESFESLEILDFRRSFEECVVIVRDCLTRV